ncbi:MAG TPA: diguanylate cyclase [Candidatus Dormibacteraeota bacterium]|nr:diguanylate cyclase [Candidatus Dormibacteraeota bacterium]
MDRAAVVAPKALAGRRLRPLASAVVAIAVAFALYRFQAEAGLALLAVLAVAAGWLLAARSAAIVAVLEAITVAACLWSGLLSWPGALVQVSLLTALIGLAHVAAEREPVVHRTAAQERHIKGLGLLLEAVESLTAASGREEILNIAVRASARGISRSGDGRGAHAAFHSVVAEQINISVVTDDPVERETVVGFEYPIANNQAARGAIRTGRPAFVRPDHMSGPLRELAESLGWQVLIVAPVYSGGSVQGLLAATARDGPSVDSLQQYMLGTLARLTSLSLESSARIDQLAAAEKPKAETADPLFLPAIVNELRDAVKPIKTQILDLRASKNRGNEQGDDVAYTFDKLDDLISALASRTAIDSTTGVLSRELGLAALERDVLRARRSQASRHCVAVLHVATSDAPNGTELIRLVADRLRAGLRREDLIFRYAEDEFVCSLADMDSAEAQPVLSRIQAELAREIGYTPFAIGLTTTGLEQTVAGMNSA